MMYPHGRGGRHFGMRFARRPHHDHDDHHHERHRRHGGGRHALGRFFAHGDLRLVILNLIADKPRHGYELIKEIEDSVGGAYSPSPGVIYPTLTLLEELNYVQAAAEGAKKLYTITSEGEDFLKANRATVDALLSRMAEAAGTQGRGRAPGIIRAMENLKMALKLRAVSGNLSDDQIDRIAQVIDEAAAKVEKI